MNNALILAMDNDDPAKPRPIPYADTRLPIGGAGYSKFEYPSDRAGFWNPAHINDDGKILKLEPGPLHRRFIGLCLIVGGCLAVVVFMAKLGMIKSALRMFVWMLLLLTILVVPGLLGARHRSRTPWIVVNRQKKLICLPRANKNIPFADVVRLQFVSCVPLGFSQRKLSYRGEPNSGELQIVFIDRAQEQTWCLVAWPDKDVVKRFVTAFRQGTDIPVSRVNHLSSGNWRVEAFDAG